MTAASPRSHPGAARVGVGGPVGSGKTALLEQLIPRFLARGTEIAVVTNDLVTKEDAERIRRSGLISQSGSSPAVSSWRKRACCWRA